MKSRLIFEQKTYSPISGYPIDLTISNKKLFPHLTTKIFFISNSDTKNKITL